MDLRLCDLGVTLDGTELEERVHQLYDELADRGLRFRPHCWLSSEWFSPAGVPGIAIPFYLAHPRLRKLEDRQMLEVEGGTKAWFMRLLRHEAGHAYETAYRLTRRKRWQRVFGPGSKPYPDRYNPRPVSKRYVLHLDWWYAQSHPTEDFAETFAVWLRPHVNWRRRYRGWPALKKLEYVDELMDELAGKAPLVKSQAKVEPVHRLKTTLREHYSSKQRHYGRDYPDFFDRDLRKLFPDPPRRSGTKPAAAFLRSVAPELRRLVARWTGEYTYTVNLVIKDMIVRCRELDLRLARPPDEVKVEAAILLTMQTMDFVYSTRHTVAL
jgi:hypothetical protein